MKRHTPKTEGLWLVRERASNHVWGSADGAERVVVGRPSLGRGTRRISAVHLPIYSFLIFIAVTSSVWLCSLPPRRRHGVHAKVLASDAR